MFRIIKSVALVLALGAATAAHAQYPNRPVTIMVPLASATRDIVQTLIGRGMTEEDFAQLLLLQAEASGIKLSPENVVVNDGLGTT